MNVPLLVAGSLALIAAAVHGVGGEVLVVRRLSRKGLPSTHFGGPETTMLMVRVTWHITTIAFLTVGAALLLAGSILEGHTARTVALVAAWGSTGFAAIALGAVFRRPRALLRHQGPIVLAAIPMLAWWGVAG
jgi:hypothetical protein